MVVSGPGQENIRDEIVEFFLAIAVDHHRHLVDERFLYHCGDGLISTVRIEILCAKLFPTVIYLLLINR